MERPEIELLIQQKNEPQNILLMGIKKDTEYIVKNNDSEHSRIFRKIDNLVDSQVALSHKNENQWKTLSDKVMAQELRDASFYGKVVIITFIISIGAMTILTKIWSSIADFLFNNK